MYQSREFHGHNVPPDDEINLHVKPIRHGGFGVYANEIAIAIYADEAAAEAHCMRLITQQEQDESGPSK